MIEPSTWCAFSVQAHKGIYAAFVGSGISTSAGIPTGWQIVESLVRRIAGAKGDNPGADWEGWYRTNFGKDPGYSDLVESLAATPAERMSLLKGYIEPSNEEKENGVKVPTLAHRSLAKLVAAGYIRIIITTNFDRLLEQALEAEKVAPVVVSTPAQIAGMMPLSHVDCLIVKLHGDYLDTRIKNTPMELSAYDSETNSLLDRILSEYGLPICGWSGEWDTAMIEAITRNTRFRFSTFWMARGGKLGAAAGDLAKRRQAIIVPIDTADRFFGDLQDRVSAIAGQRLADPITPKIAVSNMKRFLADDRYRIQLHDLVMTELKGVRHAIQSFPITSPEPTPDEYRSRVEQMEVVCSRLTPMMATGVYWGELQHFPLWKRCVESLVTYPLNAGGPYVAWDALNKYPATLAVYAACIADLARGRYDMFWLLCVDAKTSWGGDPVGPAIANIGASAAFACKEAQFLGDDHKNTNYITPGSDWVAKRLRPVLEPVIGDDLQFDNLFDEMEVVICMIAMDIGQSWHEGRFAWRYERRSGGDLLGSLRGRIGELKQEHPLIKAGLFQADHERLKKAADDLIKVVVRRW